MAVFKCKMCGGALEIEENQSVVTCSFCGTQQTVPKSADENLQQKLDLLENEKKYLLCKKTLQGKLDEEKYNKAKEQLQDIIDYKDCRDLLDQLERKWQAILQLQEEKERLEEIRKEQLYCGAVILIEKNESRSSLLDAIKCLKHLGTYKDSYKKIAEAKKLLNYYKKKRRKISAIVISTVLAVIIAFLILTPTVIRPARVNNLIEKGEYAKAVKVGKLTEFVVPDGVTEIPAYAFSDCDSLTSIIIPNSVTSIGVLAFEDCDSLTSVTIGNSVTSIGNWAFCYCDSLTSITIPNSVTSIGEGAFCECTSLTSVTIGNSVTSIGKSAFSGCPIEKATIPTIAISSIPKSVLKEVVIISGENIEGWAFFGCDSLRSVTIGNSVTSIGGWAFEDCTSLTNITFNDTTTWYRTRYSSDWNNKTDGTQTDVINSTTNATNFKSTYVSYYWYKI